MQQIYQAEKPRNSFRPNRNLQHRESSSCFDTTEAPPGKAREAAKIPDSYHGDRKACRHCLRRHGWYVKELCLEY